MLYVVEGWPRIKDESSNDNLWPYFSRRFKLSVEKGCLSWGSRVIVPARLTFRIVTQHPPWEQFHEIVGTRLCLVSWHERRHRGNHKNLKDLLVGSKVTVLTGTSPVDTFYYST